MKKICIVTPMFLPVPAVLGGGIEHLINVLIDENELNNDFLFTVYTIPNKEIKNNYNNTCIKQINLNFLTFTFKRVINKFLNIFGINKYYSFNNLLYKKIARKIRKEDCDYVLVENNMLLYKEVYKRNKNKKFLFHLHNDLNEIDKTVSDYKFINETADKIIVISNYLKNKLNGVQKSNKIFVLQNVIDDKKYLNHVKSLKNINSLKDKLGIDINDLVIGYVGRFDEEKGLLELINAYQKLKLNNVTLLLVCDDFTNFKYKKLHVQKLINAINNNKKIIITGRIPYDNIIDYYDLIDILVIPTICEEAFGLVALEGKALNKRIIYTDSGALPEILSNPSYRKVLRGSNVVENIKSAILEEIKEEKEIINKDKIDGYQDYFQNFKKII